MRINKAAPSNILIYLYWQVAVAIASQLAKLHIFSTTFMCYYYRFTQIM